MEPPFDSTLLPLVRAARKGDEQALERLLVPVHVHVSRYLYAWLERSGDDIVQDLAQECVLRVMRALAECQATTDAGFLAWCRTIAKNAGLDRFRAEKRERESLAAVQMLSAGTGDWHQDDNAHAPAIRMLLQALAEALRHEPEGAHEVLWHRLVQGDTWEAAAKGLQVSPAGSKRRYQRTIRRLDRRVRCTLAVLQPVQRERLTGLLKGAPQRRIPGERGDKGRSCASRTPVQLCPLPCPPRRLRSWSRTRPPVRRKARSPPSGTWPDAAWSRPGCGRSQSRSG
jgi:RNA polymerase sigma factor (sigma-70 family)